MKAKFCFLGALIIVLASLLIFNVQATGSLWKDDFNYANVEQMQTAGWSLTRPSGTSLENGAVILNGVGGDAAISIREIFSTPIYNWTAENKNMWLGQGHSTQSITVVTENHKYLFFADGYYNQYAFYRDDKQVSRFGQYQEAPNTWITLAIEKNGNTLTMYYNGQLQKTYTEPDTNPSKVTGVDLVSPWKGDAKYDYLTVKEANSANVAMDYTIYIVAAAAIIVAVGIGVLAYSRKKKDKTHLHHKIR